MNKEYLEKEGLLVSVIVPTHNSARTLSKCLESVARQSYKHVELVVVDRYSNDRTREIAAAHGAIILSAEPERSSQKNYGAKFAKGDFLYFVDSDFILEKDALRKCVGACKDYDALSTINYSVGASLWGKSIALKERFLAHDPTIQTARFVKREIFLEVGGFDEDLVIGEDLDLYARLLDGNYRIGGVDAIEWHIGEPENLKEIARRSVYYGKRVRAYTSKRGGYATRQLNPFKAELFLAIIKTGSPYIFSLGLVDITRWIASIAGLMCSRLD